jgi:hypothetical protein
MDVLVVGADVVHVAGQTETAVLVGMTIGAVVFLARAAVMIPGLVTSYKQ